jgi:hypothetical protein
MLRLLSDWKDRDIFLHHEFPSGVAALAAPTLLGYPR